MNNLIIFADSHTNEWLLPHDINEVWWASSALFIVVGLIWWKAGPAIKKAWDGRIHRIESELADAAETRQTAEAELADVNAAISDGDAERDRILADASQTAEELRRQLIQRAESDASDILARGNADIEAARTQAMADLSAEAGELAVGAAEAVVSATLDESAQRQLVESYIDEVGTRT